MAKKKFTTEVSATFTISVPIKFQVTVEANDKKEAIAKVLRKDLKKGEYGEVNMDSFYEVMSEQDGPTLEELMSLSVSELEILDESDLYEDED